MTVVMSEIMEPIQDNLQIACCETLSKPSLVDLHFIPAD